MLESPRRPSTPRRSRQYASRPGHGVGHLVSRRGRLLEGASRYADFVDCSLLSSLVAPLTFPPVDGHLHVVRSYLVSASACRRAAHVAYTSTTSNPNNHGPDDIDLTGGGTRLEPERHRCFCPDRSPRLGDQRDPDVAEAPASRLAGASTEAVVRPALPERRDPRACGLRTGVRMVPARPAEGRSPRQAGSRTQAGRGRVAPPRRVRHRAGRTPPLLP